MIDYDVTIPTLSIRVGTVMAAEETASATSNYALTYTDTSDNTQTLASGSDVTFLLQQIGSNRRVIVSGSEDTTKAQLVTIVRRMFTEWWSRRKSTYGWLDEMLKRRDYDPLENYDRKEDGGWKDTDDMKQRTDEFTPRTSDTVTETPRVAVRTTQTPHVAMTTQKDVYGDNSSTEVPVEKVTSSPDGENSDITEVEPISGTNQTVTTHVGKDQQIYGAHQDEHTRLFQNYRVHGNIGVSTVADMLGKEYDLRRPIDLVKIALQEWLDLYTVYVE